MTSQRVCAKIREFVFGRSIATKSLETVGIVLRNGPWNTQSSIINPVGNSARVSIYIRSGVTLKCQGGDSNPYGFLHQILSLARLPIPPPRLKFQHRPSTNPSTTAVPAITPDEKSRFLARLALRHQAWASRAVSDVAAAPPEQSLRPMPVTTPFFTFRSKCYESKTTSVGSSGDNETGPKRHNVKSCAHCHESPSTDSR